MFVNIYYFNILVVTVSTNTTVYSTGVLSTWSLPVEISIPRQDENRFGKN